MTRSWTSKLVAVATFTSLQSTSLSGSFFVSALRHPETTVAFAASGGGGFGFGKTTNSKKKKKKGKTGSLLSDIQVSNSSPQKQTENTDADAAPPLDKWGLPPPTTEDIFPLMPSGTELIPVDREKEEYTLNDIVTALKDHIELSNLSLRFDESCQESSPPTGRTPMKLSLLHRSPPVLAVEDFFTAEECEDIKKVALAEEENQSESKNGPVKVQSATFSALAQSKRTSTSWFCYYSQVPVLLAKALHVLGIPTLEQMEEPQIVRYKTGQEFSWHYDEVPPPQLNNGGQRLATLLVYLNDVENGGGTVFRDLKDGATGEMLTMKPKQGSALLFFPAYRDGRPDDRTLHKGEVAGDEKWIIQMWIHKDSYSATLPDGNFQQAAKELVDSVSADLGYAP